MPPSLVTLIRHAEKTKNRENTGLSKAGKRRAVFLVKYLSSMEPPPGRVYCFRKHGLKNRSVELMAPFIATTRCSWNVVFGNDASQSLKMVADVFSNPQNDNKHVLICWKNNTIPLVVREIARLSDIPALGKFLSWSWDPFAPQEDKSIYNLNVCINIESKSFKMTTQPQTC